MKNALPVQSMTDQERLQEAAEILATGILRLRKSSQDNEFPLDFSPAGSVHGDRSNAGGNQ